MPITKVNLADKLDQFDERWSPRIVGALNGQHVKLAKFEGDFVAHRHEDEDEMFLVVAGKLFIELADQTVELDPGEFVIIPRGVEHRPYAPEETSVLLFEPDSTLNTGDRVDERTVPRPGWL